MDQELKDIKCVLDSMNSCLYTISTNLQNRSTTPTNFSTSTSYPSSTTYGPMQNSVDQISTHLCTMSSNMLTLTTAIQTLAEIQCCILAKMQSEMPEKKSLPWSPNFKDVWAEDMEPGVGVELEKKSF